MNGHAIGANANDQNKIATAVAAGSNSPSPVPDGRSVDPAVSTHSTRPSVPPILPVPAPSSSPSANQDPPSDADKGKEGRNTRGNRSVSSHVAANPNGATSPTSASSSLSHAHVPSISGSPLPLPSPSGNMTTSSIPAPSPSGTGSDSGSTARLPGEDRTDLLLDVPTLDIHTLNGIANRLQQLYSTQGNGNANGTGNASPAASNAAPSMSPVAAAAASSSSSDPFSLVRRIRFHRGTSDDSLCRPDLIPGLVGVLKAASVNTSRIVQLDLCGIPTESSWVKALCGAVQSKSPLSILGIHLPRGSNTLNTNRKGGTVKLAQELGTALQFNHRLHTLDMEGTHLGSDTELHSCLTHDFNDTTIRSLSLCIYAYTYVGICCNVYVLCPMLLCSEPMKAVFYLI